jgi:hypothetical protein
LTVSKSAQGILAVDCGYSGFTIICPFKDINQALSMGYHASKSRLLEPPGLRHALYHGGFMPLRQVAVPLDHRHGAMTQYVCDLKEA